MRRKNLRVAVTGALMIALAIAFFFGMLTMAPRSTDPAGMMQTVGQVSGTVGALGLVMIAFGLIGRKT